MSIQKLSQRAKEVLLNIPTGTKKRKKTAVGNILDSINQSAGVGSALSKAVQKLNVDRSKEVDIARLIKDAYYQSIKMDSTYVGTEHLLRMNIFPGSMKSVERGKRTPVLDSFGENLNQKLFRDAERPIMFRDEYNSLVSVLLQKKNPNVLLVGDPGVGKRSLIELLTRNINTMDVPPLLAGYQVIEFDVISFMTSILNKGGSDFGLMALTDEIKSVGRVILSIKNFQNLFFATSAGFTVPMFYSMLRTSLENADIRVIATINSSLYDKLVTDNENILDNFSIIDVEEPQEQDTLKLLELNASYLGKFHKVIISKEVTEYVYKRAKEDLKITKFPQKGLDLLDQACARLTMKKGKLPSRYKHLIDKTFLLAQKLDKNIELGDFDRALKSRNEIRKTEDNLIRVEEIALAGPRLTLTTVEVDEALEDMGFIKNRAYEDVNVDFLTDISAKIKERIIGQNAAVDTVVKSLIRSKLGLRSKKRPLGNFLFLGPTGVGKTELAKVLSQVAFDNSIIRLDMSDFSEKHTVARLVGAPPGYIGYGEGGELTQKIETKPDSVVLFDEIEKAHPEVLNILLQIMEEGELSDAKGNTFDFSKAVIILTSNLGTELIQGTGIGFDEQILNDEKVEDRLKINLKKILKPELINRFDEVVVFRRLNSKDQLQVLNLLIKDIVKTLKLQKIGLKVGTKAKKYLLTKGYSDEYGARSLRRVLEKELLDRVAEVLLKKKERPLLLTAGTDGKNINIQCN